jgi:hypothetical protein
MDYDAYHAGDHFQILIFLDTGGQDIVATQAVATYNKDAIHIDSVDTTDSDFSLEAENNIDSDNGKIFVAVAEPTPGVNSASAKVATVNLTALQDFTGSSLDLKFDSLDAIDDCAAIADDGLGTNVLESVSNQFVNTSPNQTSPAVSISRPGLETDGQTQSLNHNSTIYISARTLIFKGKTNGLENGRVEIYSGKKKVGAKTISASGRWTKRIHISHDDTYHIFFKYFDENGNLVKKSASTTVKVDTKNPEFTDLPLFLNKRPGQEIWWKAQDNDEIKYFKYSFLGKIKKTTASHFVIPISLGRGKHLLRVKAFDRAGNLKSRRVIVDVK